MKKDKFDYSIDCIDSANYELTLNFKADNKLFEYMYEKSVTKLKKKHNIDGGSMPEVDEFDIPENFYHLIKVAIKKPYRAVCKIFKEDKIELLTHKIEKTSFKKNGDEWRIHIFITGMYADKR